MGEEADKLKAAAKADEVPDPWAEHPVIADQHFLGPARLGCAEW